MSPQKSTTVRFLSKGIKVLDQAWPALAERAAARLFFRTPRPVRSGPAHEAPRSRRRRIAGLAAEEWLPPGPLSDPSGTVLLLHGWGGRRAQLRGFAAPLVAAGLRVVAVDAPGHGESAGRTLSLPAYARAIAAVGRELGPLAAVVAHSFGGPATALALQDGLRAARVVLIGAPAAPDRWFEAFCEQLDLTPSLRQRFLARVELQLGRPMAALGIENLAEALSVPLLLIHDRGDREVPFGDAERYLRAAPHAELLATERLGHRRILRDPRVVEEAVRFVLAAPRPRCAACNTAAVAPQERLCLDCEVGAMLAHPDERGLDAA